jgi:hypothetical protein
MTAREWLNVYWLVAGGLLGFCVIGFDLLPLIWPVILLALAMVIVGAIRWHGRGAWWALISFGGMPLVILLIDIYGGGPTCPPNGVIVPPAVVPGGATSYACHGPIPDLYYMLAISFGGITLAGVVWGAVAAARHRD